MKSANENAHQVAQGELLDSDFESSDEITDSLKEISENLREKIAVCDSIKRGDLSIDVGLRSEADVFGKAFQKYD